MKNIYSHFPEWNKISKRFTNPDNCIIEDCEFKMVFISEKFKRHFESEPVNNDWAYDPLMYMGTNKVKCPPLFNFTNV